MRIKTTNCHRHGHPEFAVRCDDSIPREDVDWLVDYLERSVREGVTYAAGESIEIGWMLNRLALADDGALLISEPDMKSFPIEWTIGVTETLRQLRLQKDTAESVGLGGDLQIPTIKDSVLVGVDVDSRAEDLILERVEVAAADSGWFIGRLDSQLNYNDPENLRRISLYEAALECPRIVMFMSLPTGTRVECSRGQIAIARQGSTLKPKAGSFLDAFARSASLE